MSEVDWNAAAEVHERDDSGSDMYYDFKVLGQGTLAQMVASVMAMSAAERARVIIDARGVGSLGSREITELSQRSDFPQV